MNASFLDYLCFFLFLNYRVVLVGFYIFVKMINEVEDGELSSDQEAQSKKKDKSKSKDELSSGELILNNEEKSVLKKLIESGAESGEISDFELENPYVEEDVSKII